MVQAGKHLFKREYMMVDKLTDTDTRAREWVSEVQQGVHINGDVAGRAIYLFSEGRYVSMSMSVSEPICVCLSHTRSH